MMRQEGGCPPAWVSVFSVIKGACLGRYGNVPGGQKWVRISTLQFGAKGGRKGKFPLRPLHRYVCLHTHRTVALVFVLFLVFCVCVFRRQR